jgi:hypothetical protein
VAPLFLKFRVDTDDNRVILPLALEADMNTEIVAVYHYDHHSLASNSLFEIIANYDSWEDYDRRNVSFYDIYDKNGVCVNEGDPFYELPSWETVRKFYRPESRT